MLGNGRGVGITETLHGAAEWPVLVVFAVITQLGDVWLLFLLGSALYVAGDHLPRVGIDRRRGLFVLALVLTYVALIGVLKETFLLPRPPGAGDPPVVGWLPAAIEPVFADITTGEGYGFPSGHALGTTMVWGGVALTLEQVARRVRFGLAAAVIVLVALSRLVLGVHYAVDVVVGVAIGLVVLGALYRLSDGGAAPGRVLLVAVAVGLLGVAMGLTVESVLALGVVVGGWIVWQGVAETTPAHPSSWRAVIAGALVVGAAAGTLGAVYELTLPLSIVFLGAVAAGGGMIGAPMLGERLV